ncbi:tigger transposable element-derived protein 4-like [Drosophila willistoni]|uniref:tigger transposable element-derived protein 4-like n=1 Tax=Drosophila willistoni TaxID=7260 RepID=UPI001F0801CD|nr:tigger transposable element-derived protein 4-like [Drosophila willistoni]XP_046868024.1 tigger transposable element-derived protein 4-like [Drosophila willistoni]XP_046868025.1 tigger transposable element-derived protein 4-like [Drosophila willistoni]
MPGLKRKSFSIEKKIMIIQRLESGESNASLSREFGMSHSTISTIKKNKNRIVRRLNSIFVKPKRGRAETDDEVDESLIQWYKLKQKQGVPVNDLEIQTMANFFAKQLNIFNFNCSDDWINRFKIKHNINLAEQNKIDEIEQDKAISMLYNAWIKEDQEDDDSSVKDKKSSVEKPPNEEPPKKFKFTKDKTKDDDTMRNHLFYS